MRGDAPQISSLRMLLYGAPIGVLAQLPGEQIVTAFDLDYENDVGRATLSLSLKTASGALRTPARTRVRLPPFFSNLLPEGHLRQYLAARGGVKPIREFPLIGLLGRDLPGAIDLRATSDRWTVDSSDGPSQSPNGAAQTPLRFSLAGVQLKFSALAKTGGGLTIPVSGAGGDWIVKLPSTRFQSVPEHEHAMLGLARAVGISVPENKLLPLSAIDGLPRDLGPLDGHALGVKRFDRAPDGARVHIEDFAQVFNVYPERKYGTASSEDIARVIWAESGLDDSLEFVRRLVFTVLTGNADMHLKNWSVRYAERTAARLAPAYDLVGTIAFLPNADLALALSGQSQMHSVTMDSFRRLAAKVGLPTAAVEQTVEQTVRSFQEAWRDDPAVRGLPSRHRSTIAQHAQGLPLWRLVSKGTSVTGRIPRGDPRRRTRRRR
ncbi:MAG TPA: type II toxin-antitoxin system HipA family toxin [Gemmatimonadaceae bacterium]|nr:type II toxin-antitoxin system HipA family toxin [Gemmatimonadaceae bacterium]